MEGGCGTLETLVYGYTAVFEKLDAGRFVATVPTLSYITTEAPTLDEAREAVRDMIELYLETLNGNGLGFPYPDEREVVTERILVAFSR